VKSGGVETLEPNTAVSETLTDTTLDGQQVPVDKGIMDSTEVVPADNATTVQPPALATRPRILDHVAQVVEGLGHVGEPRAAKLLYLIVTTRIQDRIVSAVVKGPSSAGKSHLVERVLRLFPPSAYHALSAMSERALAYDRTDLSHRHLVIYESSPVKRRATSSPEASALRKI
jgi:hypothetical protein